MPFSVPAAANAAGSRRQIGSGQPLAVSGLSPQKLRRGLGVCPLNLHSEVEQVVLVLLLVLVLENSRYLTVTLIERSSAGRFGPCFDAGSQQIEHEHDRRARFPNSGIWSKNL